jgi:hypothetical protein
VECVAVIAWINQASSLEVKKLMITPKVGQKKKIKTRIKRGSAASKEESAKNIGKSVKKITIHAWRRTQDESQSKQISNLKE